MFSKPLELERHSAFEQSLKPEYRLAFYVEVGGMIVSDGILRAATASTPLRGPSEVSFNDAAETRVATLGELNPDLHPDTMVHLTPFEKADFAGGVTRTWWARWGDVSHLTPMEYRVGVVGPAAPGYGPGANLFVTASPEAGVFNLESTSAFGYREFTNATTVTPSGFFSIPNGPPVPYPEIAIPSPRF